METGTFGIRRSYEIQQICMDAPRICNQQQKNPFSIKNHDQYHLSIKDGDGIRRNIERYSYGDPREYLGVT